jgi:hypothetical protein
MTLPKEQTEARLTVRLIGGPLDNCYVSVFESYGKLWNQRNNHYSHCQDFLMTERVKGPKGDPTMRLTMVSYCRSPGNKHEYIFVDRRA